MYYVGQFENDVKAEGTKPRATHACHVCWFENDVKAEGTKPCNIDDAATRGLRMM